MWFAHRLEAVLLVVSVAACATTPPARGVKAECRASTDCAPGLVCLQHETFGGTMDL